MPRGAHEDMHVNVDLSPLSIDKGGDNRGWALPQEGGRVNNYLIGYWARSSPFNSSDRQVQEED